MLAHTYNHIYGLSTTGLRFFTVYGPYGRPVSVTAACSHVTPRQPPSLSRWRCQSLRGWGGCDASRTHSNCSMPRDEQRNNARV